MAALVTHYVQLSAELVFIEYAVNDEPESEPWEENEIRHVCAGALKNPKHHRAHWRCIVGGGPPMDPAYAQDWWRHSCVAGGCYQCSV